MEAYSTPKTCKVELLNSESRSINSLNDSCFSYKEDDAYHSAQLSARGLSPESDLKLGHLTTVIKQHLLHAALAFAGL